MPDNQPNLPEQMLELHLAALALDSAPEDGIGQVLDRVDGLTVLADQQAEVAAAACHGHGLTVVTNVDTGADAQSVHDRLDDLAHRATREGIPNLRTTHPAPTEAGLPEPVDLVFLSHVYHHLPDRIGYFGRLARSLRPGGRVAIVEGRRQGMARIFGHATEPEVVRREMESAGYRLAASHSIVPNESFQVFVPATAGGDSQTLATRT